MRRLTVSLLVSLCATLSAGSVLAKPWNGINPGESNKADVLARFGQPSKRVAQGGKEILAYTAEQAIKGTSQAQFTVLPNGKVEQMVVFPAAVLEVTEIEETFGKSCASLEKAGQAPTNCHVKQLTDDFRTYYWYKRVGLVVFFNEDKKTVHSIIYNAPSVSSGAAAAAGK